jgi:hypothetical protein
MLFWPDTYVRDEARVSPISRAVRWFRRRFTRDGRLLARRLEASRP